MRTTRYHYPWARSPEEERRTFVFDRMADASLDGRRQRVRLDVLSDVVCWLKRLPAWSTLSAVIAVAFMLAAVPALAQSLAVKYLSAASTNSTLVRSGRTALTMIAASNSTATAYFLKVYNTAVAPTCGSGTPVMTLTVPPIANGGLAALDLGDAGIIFSSGLGFCLTGALADADTTNAAVGLAINFGLSGRV